VENKLSKKPNRKELIYEIGLLMTALIWGSSFPIGKVALTYYSPLFLAMSRYLLGGIIIGIYLNKRILSITKQQLLGGALCGAIFYFAYLIQIVGLQYTAPAKQSFLAALYVIIVPFLYWIVYKKKPDIYNFVAAVLTLIGIYLLTVNGPGGFNKGDLITIFSSFLYAAHIAVIGYLVKRMDPIILTFLQTIIAGIIGLGFSLVLEPFPTEFPLMGILSVLYLTVFCTIIAYGIQVLCQKYISEMKTSILLCLESVFGTLLSVIFLNDPFTIVMFIGCIIIFIGILTSETKWAFLKKKK
jgi:drug/metabolite transporter (DMT)-like permease